MAGYANNQKFCSFCAFVYLILTYVVDPYSQDAEDSDGDDGVFCACQETVYGDMVACDGPDCPYIRVHGSILNVLD